MSTGNLTEQGLTKILKKSFESFGKYFSEDVERQKARTQTIEDYAKEDLRNLMLMGPEAAGLVDKMTTGTRRRVAKSVAPSVSSQFKNVQDAVAKWQEKRGLGSPSPEFTRGKPAGPKTPQAAFLKTIQDLLLALRQDARIQTEEPTHA
jgi:hypothetical protein